MSKLLASLEGVPEADSLVEGLRRGNRAYEAEATAIHLLRLDGDDSIVDLYPVVPVAGRHDRRGDFRVRRGVDPWVYVEVSATDRTAREREASHLLETLSHPIESMNGSFAVELFFHNVPDAREVDIIRQLLGGLNGRSDSTAAELPGGLGVLVFDKDRDPVDVSPRVKNDPYRPGLGRSTVIHRDGEVRSISVRLPYADTRGHAKVSKESKQLPKDGPGLVMIDVAGAPGSHHSWEPTIRADLRNHSRVSAVLLFRWGLRAGAAPRCNIVDFG